MQLRKSFALSLFISKSKETLTKKIKYFLLTKGICEIE